MNKKWKAKWENNKEREKAYTNPAINEVIYCDEWRNKGTFSPWNTLPKGDIPTIVYHKGQNKSSWILTLCEYYIYIVKKYLRIFLTDDKSYHP